MSLDTAQRHDKSGPADPRAVAWHILQRIEEGGYADALVGAHLQRAMLGAADRALMVRLVYGTVAWQLYLDHLLAGFSSRPLSQLDPAVRTLLRMALYQVVHLARVPDFAAVDTAVRLAKRHRRGQAVPFVNAVLRQAAKGWRHVPLPSPERDLAGYLSVRFSHPRWLVDLWLAEYGPEQTHALLAANNEPAPTVLRVNRLRVSREALLERWRNDSQQAVPGRYSPVALELRGRVERGLSHDASEYTVQAEAAQLVGFLVAPQPGDSILDACAAPGGKCTHLAELMNDSGVIVALDPNPRRVERIRKEVRRLGLSIVRAEQADALTWTASPPLFDRVLIDAPCSGLGTLRQHPEIRWRRKREDLTSSAALQLRLLRAGAAKVRPGGVLVYATCTLTREENESVIDRFLAVQPGFRVEDPRSDLPDSARELIGPDAFLRTLPHRHSLDGFFAARLRRLTADGIV